jgi:hypothetical protein
LKRRQKSAALSSQAIDGIPGDSLYSGDRRLVQALDAESGNFVEGRATVLELMVRRTDVRAKCLSASSAPVSAALPGVGAVEAVANNVSGAGIFRQKALRVWTQTLH